MDFMSLGEQHDPKEVLRPEVPLPLLAFKRHCGKHFISPSQLEFVTEMGITPLTLVEKGRLHIETPDFSTSVVCAVKSFRPHVSAFCPLGSYPGGHVMNNAAASCRQRVDCTCLHTYQVAGVHMTSISDMCSIAHAVEFSGICRRFCY